MRVPCFLKSRLDKSGKAHRLRDMSTQPDQSLPTTDRIVRIEVFVNTKTGARIDVHTPINLDTGLPVFGAPALYIGNAAAQSPDGQSIPLRFKIGVLTIKEAFEKFDVTAQAAFAEAQARVNRAMLAQGARMPGGAANELFGMGG